MEPGNPRSLSDNAFVVKTRVEDTDKKQNCCRPYSETPGTDFRPHAKRWNSWVQGGRIELPCRYFVYGLKTSKQRVKHELRKHQ